MPGRPVSAGETLLRVELIGMMRDIAHGGSMTATALQKAAAAVAVVFLLAGVLGFVPGITTNYDSLRFLGDESDAQLLGVFQVSILHNIVHLLFGVAGLALARSSPGARAFLIGGGIVYLVLFVYGMVIDRTSEANFVPLNRADDWLHLGLAAGMIGLGLLLGTHRLVRGRLQTG